MRRLLVTGGAGFIGSAYVRLLLARDPDAEVTVLDKLTYAGNRANLQEVEGDPRLRFVQGDICDAPLVDGLAAQVDAILNFAAETHVDRSLMDAGEFVRTDVDGTWVLLDAAKRHRHARFLQVSTDEVYGHVPRGRSKESHPLAPRSPYAASKAGGEMMVRAYRESFGLPTLVTRGSNTYGPYQFPEKIIPLFITNALADLKLPVYGDGSAQRDYIFVEDHAAAMDLVLRRGEPGHVYNIGSGRSTSGTEIARAVLRGCRRPVAMIQYVADRQGHDYRYALNTEKIRALGWAPRYPLGAGLKATINWYRSHESWWAPLKSASFWEYYRRNYRPLPEAAGARAH
jgi:dTDP-glucose 4,6-dehydratase